MRWNFHCRATQDANFMTGASRLDDAATAEAQLGRRAAAFGYEFKNITIMR